VSLSVAYKAGSRWCVKSLMKLYKNLVNAVAEILQEIFVQKKYADKVLERHFKQHPQWGSRDRRFVAEAVYDIVRYYRLYSEIVDSKNNFWFITAAWLVIKKIEFPDWPEFKSLNRAEVLVKYKQLLENPVLAQSYPDWLWQLGTDELGRDVWEKEASEMNTTAKLVLRVNNLKCNAEKLTEAFEKLDLKLVAIDGVQDAFYLTKRENLFQNKFFKEGWFEIQDAGSQQIGLFLNPQPGEVIIDACAGAGGKSLQLAALMKNKGKILSMDVESWKLEELKKRAKRAGAFNIETRLIENQKSIKQYSGRADKLLLDVPCSGLGVIRRNPDAKWKLSPEVIERTKNLQAKILGDYSEMVKIKGELIYSTCSLLPSENKSQVDQFVSQHNDFKLIEDKTIFPSEGYDGFYMARLKRIN